MAFPDPSVILSHILVVADMPRTVAWYRDVLGAKLFREYGGTTAVFEVNGAWLVLVTGGGPTADKPGISMAAPAPTGLDRVSHSMTFRVADCQAAYDELSSRGAEFLTPPVDHGGEVRAFFRDPDGHLFEISEARG
ncbi:MAG: VOC family protein [Thermoplasmatota archaeon]